MKLHSSLAEPTKHADCLLSRKELRHRTLPLDLDVPRCSRIPDLQPKVIHHVSLAGQGFAKCRIDLVLQQNEVKPHKRSIFMGSLKAVWIERHRETFDRVLEHIS